MRMRLDSFTTCTQPPILALVFVFRNRFATQRIVNFSFVHVNSGIALEIALFFTASSRSSMLSCGYRRFTDRSLEEETG